MKPDFKDYFSKQSDIYAKSRPTYPDRLFEFLASLAPAKNKAWDCATGNGQAAVPLARYFKNIIATDASSGQISNAFKHPQITYYVAPAEDSKIDEQTIDLITVASGIHWFDRGKFYREVDRVLNKRGIIAAWCYTGSEITPDIDKITNYLFFDILKDYWPEENKLVWNKYENLEFPFEELEFPDFDFQSMLTFDQLVNSLNSLSATQRYKEANRTNPVDQILKELTTTWGDVAKEKLIKRDFCMKLGRKKS